MTIIFSLLSSALLILCFPKFNFSVVVWFALVPLFHGLWNQSYKRSFWLSYLAGFVFFWGTLYWFIYVTWVGAVALISYLSLYFAIFGLAYRYFSRLSFPYQLIVLPSTWVVLEFMRNYLLGGFGWASLAYSQYFELPLIQIVDITGYYGVSFLIVMMNVAIFHLTRREKKNPIAVFFIVGIIFCANTGYGIFRIQQDFGGKNMTIGLIQSNIALEDDWNPHKHVEIIENNLKLSQEALKGDPDILIWSETSFPGIIWESPDLFERVKDFTVKYQTPILLGTVVEINGDFFNTAMLVEDGNIMRQYDKLHLVPFGEYVPLRKLFPFLETVVPIEDFTSGQHYVLFPTVHVDKEFSSLICFEDTVPHLVRNFVREGSDLLVNLTNDAWFRDTKAPYVHLQAAVFRTIENRKPLVRAANTGVSCFITPYGEVQGCVQNDKKKETFIDGYLTGNVLMNEIETFYTKYGDVFTYFCFLGILWGVIKRRRSAFHEK